MALKKSQLMSRTAIIALDYNVKATNDPILDFFGVYQEACNWTMHRLWKRKTFGLKQAHDLVYYPLRDKFNLPAQLAVSVYHSAIESGKAAYAVIRNDSNLPKDQRRKVKEPHFDDLIPVGYDIRSMILDFKENTVSLLTTTGRKLFNFTMPDYYYKRFTVKKYLKHLDSQDIYKKQYGRVDPTNPIQTKSVWTPGGANLVYKKGRLYLHLTFVKAIPPILELPLNKQKALGVDLGRTNFAVDSNGKFYTDVSLLKLIRKAQAKRKEIADLLESREVTNLVLKDTDKILVKAGKKPTKVQLSTRSLERHLRRLDRRIDSYWEELCYKVANELFSSVAKPTGTLVLEDLKHSPSFTRAGWPYAKFRRLLSEEAQERGIRLAFVPPAYTSQRCSKCGHTAKNNRKGETFECKKCGHETHADTNGAVNIRDLYLGRWRQKATCKRLNPGDPDRVNKLLGKKPPGRVSRPGQKPPAGKLCRFSAE